MKNRETLKYFNELANNAIDEKATKINSCNDYSEIDANFILKYATSDSKILDLASGTGITINKYCDKVGKIVAVECCEKFTSFIRKTSKIDIIIDNIFDFETNMKFDIITMFGIMHYVSEEEATYLYGKYKNYLKKNGKLIIKQQFGVEEDVDVCGYSKELNKDYFSVYRQIDKEVEILKSLGYKNIETFDIYPKEANRWTNTHFYAIVTEV